MIDVVFEIEGRYNEWFELRLNHIPRKGDEVYFEDDVMFNDNESYEVFNVCYVIDLSGITKVDITLKKKN